MDLSKTTDRMILAVIAGMKIVRDDQGRPTEAKIKAADQTFVTSTDKASEAAMIRILNTIPDVRIHAEESAASNEAERYVVFVDPLDGTGAFANGLSTSTVIAALYDEVEKRLLNCIIGEPVTGRIWYAMEDTRTVLMWYSYRFGRLDESTITATAWKGVVRGVTNRDTVLLDVSHGFNALNNDQMTRLYASLCSEVRIHIPGSNGLIQALVANGAKTLAGSISTAKGGAWDLCGALLVTRSGGTCHGFKKVGNKLVAHDPLDPVGCDVLITANTPAIADYLAEKVMAVF